MTRFIKTIEKFKFQSGGRGKKTKANVAHFSLRAVDTLLDYLIVWVDGLFIKYIFIIYDLDTYVKVRIKVKFVNYQEIIYCL